MTDRERDMRMFEVFRMGAVGFLLAGLLLAGPNIIGFDFFVGFIIVSATMMIGSVCGQFLLAHQTGDVRLSRPRSMIVAMAMVATILGGTYLHSFTLPPKKAETVSISADRKAAPLCCEFVESAPPTPMELREWGDLNIEPDGFPSEEGVWH